MSNALYGLSILVIEDDYLISESLCMMLSDSGALPLQPVGWLSDALKVAEDMDKRIDVALVDVNLHGDASYPAVDLLLARGVPVIFMTGYGAGGVRAAYAACEVCTKPYSRSDIVNAVARNVTR